YIRTFNQELKFDLFKTQTLIATISIALDKLNLINDERFHPLIDKSVLHCTDLKGHLEELIIKEANNYVEVGLKGAILNGHTISANLTGKILGIFQSIIKALSSQTAGSSEAALVAVVPGSVNLCLKATASSYDPPIYSTTNILNAIFSAETNNYRQYFENNKTHTKALEPIIKFCEVLAENELNVMIKATNIIGGDKASVNISYDKANECKGIFTEIRNNLERQEKTLIFDGLVDGYRLTKKTVWLLWIENGKQIEVKYDKNQEEIILRISNERLTAKFEVKQITEIKKNKKTNKTVTLYELVHVVDDQTEREYL
ncbi:MAG: hypothetical protein LBV04_05740, partial [Deferribacteraceae bacterium]|nr:hypothetical protein [Deferribacteraceae bacterium]